MPVYFVGVGAQFVIMTIFVSLMFLVALPFTAAQTLTPPSCNAQCETITASQCASQAYNLTGFPNFFGHANIMEANLNAAYIEVAVSENCYGQTRELLCGTLYPECRPNEGLVFPRRQMCEEFLTGCAAYTPLLAQLGLAINCDGFQVEPMPVCYPQPTSKMTTKSKVSPSMTPKMTRNDDGDGDDCPDENQKCAGFSINSKVSGFLLLCLAFVRKIML
ncbi:frizzled-3-like [Amphiura filiformis]|uniref:frizzled-3-like n=1 Tax=Amphiura filiformis TaxID=82378 RepID=UPI003B20E1FE